MTEKIRREQAETSILSMGSEQFDAFLRRSEYSRYSATLCRKLSGSLNITGIVILVKSCNNVNKIILQSKHTQKLSLILMRVKTHLKHIFTFKNSLYNNYFLFI